MQTKVYIVYAKCVTDDVFVVKANNKKEAVNKVREWSGGYRKKDIRAFELEKEIFNNGRFDKIAVLL